jgi:hypothetical protein
MHPLRQATKHIAHSIKGETMLSFRPISQVRSKQQSRTYMRCILVKVRVPVQSNLPVHDDAVAGSADATETRNMSDIGVSTSCAGIGYDHVAKLNTGQPWHLVKNAYSAQQRSACPHDFRPLNAKLDGTHALRGFEAPT